MHLKLKSESVPIIPSLCFQKHAVSPSISRLNLQIPFFTFTNNLQRNTANVLPTTLGTDSSLLTFSAYVTVTISINV